MLICLSGLGSSAAGKEIKAKPKLTIIGIDAGDLFTINYLREKGLLPTFDQLMKTGVYGKLESIYPTFSPIVWTTIATGKTPLAHGVRGFRLYQPESDKSIPMNATVRQAKTFWQILSQYNHSSLITAWFSSWPADQINGTIISDYVFKLRKGSLTEAFLRREVGIDMRRQTYPENVLPEISRFLIDKNGRNDRFAKRFGVTVAEAPFALKHSYAKDLSYFRIYRYLRQKKDYDLSTFYLQGPDLLGHQFMKETSDLMRGRLTPGSEEYQKGNFTLQYYRFIDVLLKEYLDKIRAPNETVLIASDHGFEDKNKYVLSKVSDSNFAKRRYWHRKHGLIIANGPEIKPGLIHGATVFDIAPTVLAFFDLPAAKDMQGRTLKEIAREPQKSIPSYDDIDANLTPDTYSQQIFQKISDLNYGQSRD